MCSHEQIPVAITTPEPTDKTEELHGPGIHGTVVSFGEVGYEVKLVEREARIGLGTNLITLHNRNIHGLNVS